MGVVESMDATPKNQAVDSEANPARKSSTFDKALIDTKSELLQEN